MRVYKQIFDHRIEKENTGSNEDSSEIKTPETEIEKKQTDELTKQLSSSWTGDGFDILQRRLSRLGSGKHAPWQH